MITSRSSNRIADDLLSAYIDGQISGAERQQVEAVLAQDADAARQLAGLRYAVNLLADMPAAPLPRPLTLHAAQVEPAPRRDWLAWLRPLELYGAAALMAVFLLVLIVGNLGLQPQLAPSAPQAAGLTPDEGNPTAIIAKTSTSDAALQTASPSPWLSPGLILSLEVGLAVFLALFLVAGWQQARAP